MDSTAGIAVKDLLRVSLVSARNLVLFASIALQHRVSLRKWPNAWRGIKADHLAQVRKVVFQLRMKGKVRQDKDGKLYSTKGSSK